MKHGIAIALTLAALTVAETEAQTRPPLTLEMLTVPANLLPEGCTLRPPTSQPQPIAITLPPSARTIPARTLQDLVAGGTPVTVAFRDSLNGFGSNPFIARERSDVYRMRTALDGGVGGVRLPDAPPMTAAETAEFQMRYVRNVIDGYWASYTTPQNDSVEIYAIRFNDPELALETRGPVGWDRPFSPSRPNAAVAERIVKGPIVVGVRGNTSTLCFDAVKTYLKALR